MNPDFSQITDYITRESLRLGYQWANENNMIDFFKNSEPPENTGYMFWDAPELYSLSKYYDDANLDLSGAMFAFACRNLQAYIQNPQEALYQLYYSQIKRSLSNNRQ
jgi:hypothetical protein